MSVIGPILGGSPPPSRDEGAQPPPPSNPPIEESEGSSSTQNDTGAQGDGSGNSSRDSTGSNQPSLSTADRPAASAQSVVAANVADTGAATDSDVSDARLIAEDAQLAYQTQSTIDSLLAPVDAGIVTLFETPTRKDDAAPSANDRGAPSARGDAGLTDGPAQTNAAGDDQLTAADNPYATDKTA